ncbi:hypothetical protein D3272_00955 [Lichenibacterium ramalinae]|uniref:Uncharacterized protein n=1 Tax=Lichenibacterium ramalinae TaxID=2316527 RepID=A0A4Q2RIC9_9HYPH|nr:hypothetical protein D3272_00955 [Lichenibacterium ramalinae]
MRIRVACSVGWRFEAAGRRSRHDPVPVALARVAWFARTTGAPPPFQAFADDDVRLADRERDEGIGHGITSHPR